MRIFTGEEMKNWNPIDTNVIYKFPKIYILWTQAKLIERT